MRRSFEHSFKITQQGTLLNYLPSQKSVLYIKDFTEIVGGKFVDSSGKNKVITAATTTTENDSLIMPASDADIIAATTLAGCYSQFYTDDTHPKTVVISSILCNADGYLFCNNNKIADFFILSEWSNPVTTLIDLRNTLTTDKYLLHTNLLNNDDSATFDNFFTSENLSIDPYNISIGSIEALSLGLTTVLTPWDCILSKVGITTGALRFSTNNLNYQNTLGTHIGLATSNLMTDFISLAPESTGKFKLRVYKASASQGIYTDVEKTNGHYKIVIAATTVKVYRWRNSAWVQVGSTITTSLSGTFKMIIQTRATAGVMLSTLFSDIYLTPFDYTTLYPS